MKKLCRLLLLAAALGALGLLPFRRTDVSELIPVRTVIITRSGDRYEVDVGEGLKALGDTVAQALDRLRREAPGEVFYKTAEQVVITEEAAEAVGEVVTEPDFRPAAGLYLTPDPAPDGEKIGQYLTSHPGDTTLSRVRGALEQGMEPGIPRIRRTEGGYLVTR